MASIPNVNAICHKEFKKRGRMKSITLPRFVLSSSVLLLPQPDQKGQYRDESHECAACHEQHRLSVPLLFHVHPVQQLKQYLDHSQTKNERDGECRRYLFADDRPKGEQREKDRYDKRYDMIFRSFMIMGSIRLRFFFHALPHLSHQIDHGEDEDPHHVDKVPV